MKCRWYRLPGVLLLLALAILPAQVAAVELNIMSIYDDTSATGVLFNQYLAEYQKMNPDVKLNKVAIRGSDKEKLFTQIAAGVGPDIMVVPQEYLVEYLNKGVVQAIPPTLVPRAEAGFIPAALKLARWQGVLYGFPTESQPQALLYNRRLLAESGIPDVPPKTWDEARNMAKKMARYDAQNNLSQLGFGMNSGVEPFLSLVLAYSLGNGYNPVAGDMRNV